MLSISIKLSFFIRGVLSLLLIISTPLFAGTGKLSTSFCRSSISDLHHRFMPYTVIPRDALSSIPLEEKINSLLRSYEPANSQAYLPPEQDLRKPLEQYFVQNNTNSTFSAVYPLSLNNLEISDKQNTNFQLPQSCPPFPLETQEEIPTMYYQLNLFNFGVQSPFKTGKQENYNDTISASTVQTQIEVKKQEIMTQAHLIFKKGYNRANVQNLQFIMQHFAFHEAVANFNDEGMKHVHLPCSPEDLKSYCRELKIARWGFKKRRITLNTSLEDMNK